MHLPYVRIYFLAAPVKCFLIPGSNNSDSIVFGNATFGEIKDHSLRTTPFQKNLLKKI